MLILAASQSDQLAAGIHQHHRFYSGDRK
jgi:hypothetical protein